MSDQNQCLVLDLKLSHHDYRLSLDTSGPMSNVLNGRVIEDGKEVFTIHSTGEDENAVKRVLLAEAHRRSNQVLAEISSLGQWTCQGDKP